MPPGFVTLEIETLGDERFVRGFNRYVARMKDFTPIFEELLEDFREIEEKNFASQGTPKAFAPLSTKYKAWKERHYPGRPIMELRGVLKASLVGRSPDSVINIDRKSAEYGTSVKYAHRHQKGTYGMPVRKIVQLTESDKTRWARKIHQWSYEELQRSIPFHERQLQ